MDYKVSISHREAIAESPADFSHRSLSVVYDMLVEALEVFDLEGMVGGKSVFIKPNFVRPDYAFNPAATSDPRAVLMLGKLVYDCGASQVWIGDNPGVGLSFKEAIKNIPWWDKWSDYGIAPFYYEDYGQVEIELPGAVLFHRMIVPQRLLEFDVFINLAKIKMHMHTGASLGIKNLYGLLADEQRMTFHRQDVNIKLVDILRNFVPDLTVLEGLWALQGQAPICGEPVKDFNSIIVGTNITAVDVIGSRAIGFSPEELTTNRLAHRAGLGPIDLEEIEIMGTPIERVWRHLKRPVVSSMGAYANCVVYELGADIGLMSSLRHALDKLHYMHILDDMPVNTFILGNPGSFHQTLSSWEGDLWLIGDDVCRVYGQADNIFRVPGNPPHFAEILRALMERYARNIPDGNG